jgi:uncharacterized protein (TIGR02453 family)
MEREYFIDLLIKKINHMEFKGFTNESLTFLKNLAANNNKEWFNLHRQVYEDHIMLPLRQLASELGPFISSIDPEIETAPAVNKTISKIYRDTRFSKDKEPFRTGLWISFRRPNKIWGNVPEFYFYFTPEEYLYGMGFYSATPAIMAKFRQNIELDPKRFGLISGQYGPEDKIGGEDYRKFIPNELPPDFQKWYQKRNLYISRSRKPDTVFFSPGLRQEIQNSFEKHAPLYLFLMESILQQ